MAGDITMLGPHQDPATNHQAKPLILPFINTSFATGLKLYFVLWPLWWLMGIEQLLPIFFLSWVSLRHILRAHGRVRLGDTVPFALLLALWWLVPIGWVRAEMFDVFIRTFLIIVTQALMLFLFVNCVRTERDWRSIVTGLDWLSVYILIGMLLFVFGGVRGQMMSAMGYLLPASLYQSSEFFDSIVFRNFGQINPGSHGVLPYRLSSFALEPADLGTLSLVLIPFTIWRISQSRGLQRFLRLLLLTGLFYCFVYAEVRIAYIAFTAGAVFFAAWVTGLLQSQNRLVLWAIVTLSMALLIGSGYFVYQEVWGATVSAFSTVRPGSIFVRLQIYRETFRLLPEHLIAGWGTSIRIEGLSSVYAAGTHSTYLEMLFQHGIVGLLLYVGLWATIWHRALYWFRRPSELISRTFWCMMVITLLMLNIRESTSSWMWDQTVAMAVWSIWGMIISAAQAHREHSVI